MTELAAHLIALGYPSPAGEAPEAPEPTRGTQWLTTVQAAQQLGISRWTLDEMVGRAPKNLPGAPQHVGSGRKRRHLRWNAAPRRVARGPKTPQNRPAGRDWVYWIMQLESRR